jgi:hydroxyethylthiazole kinase-like uncharacterized protein yjeF
MSFWRSARLVTTAEMRALERQAFDAGVTEGQLMERAGTAVAEAAAEWLGVAQGRRWLTLAGKGNNGGDAIIATRTLWQRYGIEPRIYLAADRGDDPLLAWAREAAVPVAIHEPRGGGPLRQWLTEADVVLDGLLGIGARLPLGGALAEILRGCRELAPPGQQRIAVDVPSGVQADSGQLDPWAFRADLTLATGPAKPGLFIHPGAAHAGRVRALDIGLAEADEAAPLWRAEAPAVAQLLPARPDDSHKGTYGKVLVVAGSGRYLGAAYLAAAAAVRAGAGLVTLAVPRSVQAMIGGRSVETTYLALEDDSHAPGSLTTTHVAAILEAAGEYDAVALGPGIGSRAETRATVRRLAQELAAAEAAPPVVIDADGLNALAVERESPPGRAGAAGSGEASAWADYPQDTRWVLTPHPGEMSRLTGRSTAEVQADRLTTAREGAKAWRQVVVLKGAPSITAAPHGQAALNAFANAALATAGSGDVLTGTIAAMLAQGLPPFQAAVSGSYLHALAAELWRARHGAAGLAVSHLAEHLPDALRHLHRQRRSTA